MMYQVISRASFNPGAKFIILFINLNIRSTNESQKKFAFDLFSLMYDRYNAANVMFLYAVDGDEYNIYVTNPYLNAEKCGKNKQLIDL